MKEDRKDNEGNVSVGKKGTAQKDTGEREGSERKKEQRGHSDEEKKAKME